jgi:uncharacterized protein (TIGR03663 family)
VSLSPSSLLRFALLALVVLGAAWLRTRDLAARPMHADEANQAVKVGELLEAGRYAFDPRDHHGPTLYYAAAPLAWLRGERSLPALTETTLRLVPALAGTASVLLLFFLARPLGRYAALAASALLAVSPPAVYYSRYFVQETLLVTCLLAALVCAQRWRQTSRLRWAALAGVAVGLMQATKASAPLFVAAAVAAVLVAGAQLPAWRRALVRAAVPAFFATTALFYSSFFTHLAGLGDALSAYAHAVTRFGQGAPPSGHEKPFAYYFSLFGWFRSGGLVWHQLAFSALALTGAALALLRRRQQPFLLFAFAYTAIVTLTFSAFPYKTPWHAVHFVPGAALLAAAALASIAQLGTGRPLAWAFALVALATQFQQTQRVAFQRPADQRNPYAYVHSGPDVRKYLPRAETAVARFPDQPVRIIAEEYWPLPWYLRRLPQVGYYAAPPEECDGAFLVVSPTHIETVRARLKRPYSESFLGLRPGVILILLTQELAPPP